METKDWLKLFQLAEKHHILPMIFEAVYNCSAAKQMDPSLFMAFKRKTVQMVTMQAMKTNEFLYLFSALKKAGVKTCVVKGIICRELYPNPDHRISGDEDVLISPDQFELCHNTMIGIGMQPVESEKDIFAEYEVPYGKKGSPLYIELHKYLFPPDSEAYGDFVHYFDDVMDRLMEVPVQGCVVTTMEPTDHLFYLICHAFKHFLHSGFGIRQVCDIVLFANHYGEKIEWDRIIANCRKIHAEHFAVSLFRIGENYLTFDPEKAHFPKEWKKIAVDEEPMLMDLLDSGIYGDSSMSRKHSSNMTLSAVSANKQGKKQSHGVLRTLFPPAKSLEGRFPYLQKRPYLLPVAWVDRILRYRKETQRISNDDAVESIKIGNQRTELLRYYKIVNNGH